MREKGVEKREMKNRDRFTGRIFRRMWGPAIISSAGWALSDIADAVVVGQRMGAVGLAAIALILPVYMINCMFAHGLGLGGSVRYSRLLGEGKPGEAVDSFNQVVTGALAFSILTGILGNVFMTPFLAVLGTVPDDGPLFEATRSYLVVLVSATPLFYMSNILNYYLRNDDNEKIAGLGSVAGNLTDIGFNILFVLILGYGTAGAALSTMIGQAVAILCYLPGILGGRHILKFRPVRPAPGAAAGAFKDGCSSSVQYLYQLIFLLLCNNILIRAGNEASVAAFDMLQNASYLILYLYEGTTRAMQPMVSTYCGEHRREGMRNVRRYAFRYGCSAGGLAALLIFLFPRFICALFGLREAAAAAMGAGALRLYCAGTVFAGISILLAGYFQSCNQERESLIISSLRGAIVLIPGVLFFSFLRMGLFWWMFPAVEVLSLGLWIIRFLAGRGRNEEFDGSRVYTCTVNRGNQDMTLVTGEAGAFCEKWEASPRQTYYVTMTIEELCVVILRDGGGDDVCIEITLVAGQQGEFVLHIRDTAKYFDPFALETGRVSQEGSFDMDAMGVRVVKSKAKDFFYRRYGGFNSLVVKI